MEESANFISLDWDRSAPEPHQGGTISNRPEKRIGATKGTILCHLELLATHGAIRAITNCISCRGGKRNCSWDQTCCQEREEEDQGRCEETAQAKCYSAQTSCKSLIFLQLYAVSVNWSLCSRPKMSRNTARTKIATSNEQSMLSGPRSALMPYTKPNASPLSTILLARHSMLEK